MLSFSLITIGEFKSTFLFFGAGGLGKNSCRKIYHKKIISVYHKFKSGFHIYIISYAGAKKF